MCTVQSLHTFVPPFLSPRFYFDQNVISFPLNFDILTLVQSSAAVAIVATDGKIWFMLVGRQSMVAKSEQMPHIETERNGTVGRLFFVTTKPFVKSRSFKNMNGVCLYVDSKQMDENSWP